MAFTIKCASVDSAFLPQLDPIFDFWGTAVPCPSKRTKGPADDLAFPPRCVHQWCALIPERFATFYNLAPPAVPPLSLWQVGHYYGDYSGDYLGDYSEDYYGNVSYFVSAKIGEVSCVTCHFLEMSGSPVCPSVRE